MYTQLTLQYVHFTCDIVKPVHTVDIYKLLREGEESKKNQSSQYIRGIIWMNEK